MRGVAEEGRSRPGAARDGCGGLEAVAHSQAGWQGRGRPGEGGWQAANSARAPSASPWGLRPVHFLASQPWVAPSAPSTQACSWHLEHS